MKLVERVYATPQPGIAGETLQTQINTFARHVSHTPPTVRIHETPASHVVLPISSAVSPFYTYAVHITSPVSAELHITPNTRYDSNRYHSVVTSDGTMLTRRGKSVYKLGTSTLHNEHEQLGIAVSSPRRGRKLAAGYEVAATLSYSPFYPLPREKETPLLTEENMARVQAFLSRAAASTYTQMY